MAHQKGEDMRNQPQITRIVPGLFVLAALAAGLLALPAWGTASGAADGAVDVFGPACGKAFINGIAGASEWSGASSKTVSMLNYSGKPAITATIHVMNGRNFLYVGVTVNDDEFSTQGEFLPLGDGFFFLFDEDLSGSVYELNNNALTISAGAPQFHDSYVTNLGGSNQDDTLGGGTANGSGAATRTNNLNHFEMRFPLCSGEPLDFCLHPTDTTGFRLEYLDAEANGDFGGTWFYPGSAGTSEAHITIGTCANRDLYVNLPFLRR
jgi:hypothetical protein